ncbi:MAG: TPM domain-containing protein [Candidatus Acidiferrum sp.]
MLLLAAMHALCAPASHAEDLNKITATGYVTDLAGTLDPNAKANLEALCTELQQKTGAQMAIVTVHSLEGRSVEDYAADLYKHLGVGPKKDDRGVLLLVSPDEKKYRIEVGYGLEPVINDARAGDVGRAMVPFLRSGNFDGAIQTAAWQLAQFVAGDSGVTLSLAAPARAAPQPDSDDRSRAFGAWVVLIIIIIYLIIGGISRGRRGGGGRGFWWFLLGMFLGGSGGGGGYSGGGFGGSSGGSDFGGFGGGSSGGGGASGSW